MAIRRQAAPCWVLQWEGQPVTERGGQFDTEQAAADAAHGGRLAMHRACGGVVVSGLDAHCTLCEAGSLGGADWEMRSCAPAQLPFPCWVFGCDCGQCDPDDHFDVNGGGTEFHRGSETAARALAWDAGWRVALGGLAYADGCELPPGAVLAPPPPAAQESAGQLALGPAVSSGPQGADPR